jgi:uncharacterized membrane protein YcaP (DUF421 family)
VDPLRIAVRAIFAYAFLLTLIRLSGKHTVAHGTTVEFVLAVIFGDMIDDLVWAEVSAAQFVTAAGTLFVAQLAATGLKIRRAAGRRSAA